MNLLDLQTRTWSQVCLDATASQLERLLGEPRPSTSVLVLEQLQLQLLLTCSLIMEAAERLC